MRISIREQLGLLVLLTSLTALAVIAVATWINNSRFVLSIRSSGLALTASLKAAQVSTNLMLLESTIRAISTRLRLQTALQRYRDNGNNTESNWGLARADMEAALGAVSLLVQGILFPSLERAPADQHGLLNATSRDVAGVLALPFAHLDGAQVKLGDPGLGFPPSLYPNLTYASVPGEDGSANRSWVASYNGRTITRTSTLLLGPFRINSTSALLSMTVPVVNNTSTTDVLGYLTIVIDASLIYDVVASPEGLGNSGGVVIVGPCAVDNRFPAGSKSGSFVTQSDNGTAAADLQVGVLWGPVPGSEAASRHVRSGFDRSSPGFPMKDFPAVLSAFTEDNGGVNNAHSLLASRNEEGRSVAVGFARPPTILADWVLVVEQDQYQAVAPVRQLRNVLLACVFGTTGLILLAVFPIAHFSVRPIRRLRQATKDSVEPPGYDGGASSPPSTASGPDRRRLNSDEESQSKRPQRRGWPLVGRWRAGRGKPGFRGAIHAPGHGVRVPKKVQDGRHFIHDELTDLTRTFNEMSDELMAQYDKLEERVQERTRELELSKKAAEAANESKTLFIANISHEFRTPLNAILGLTAVCMEEREMSRIQRSLGIIYKSGDLLLHLLTDLLTFSKNQVGQQLTLDEKEFRLGDISAQILSIFEKQAAEGSIDLRASFSLAEGDAGEKAHLPVELNRLKDVHVWGDQNRILQVVINLVGNSLKFTPAGQSIELRIRCLGEVEPSHGGRKAEPTSKQTPLRPSRLRQQRSNSSGISPGTTSHSSDNIHTALSINALETEPLSAAPGPERSPSPVPEQSQTYQFEFEVEDTGPGIPEHLQARVFEPFVQGDLGLTKRYGGTGLGLSICSQLAKLMGGTITLRSQVGVGSTFTMRIPLKIVTVRPGSTTSSMSNLNSRPSSMGHFKTSDEEPPGADRSIPSLHGKTNGINHGTGSAPRLVGLSQPFFAPSSSPDPPEPSRGSMEDRERSRSGGRIRVLVAEDNKINQEVVLRMLKLEDIYDVAVAKDGQEAYEKVKESMEQNKLFHLIFMDVQMPNLDGLQSTRLIREIGFASPIVALTAFAEESNFKECIKSGMNSFLAKPIRRAALQAILKAYCPPIPEEKEDEHNANQNAKPESKA